MKNIILFLISVTFCLQSFACDKYFNALVALELYSVSNSNKKDISSSYLNAINKRINTLSNRSEVLSTSFQETKITADGFIINHDLYKKYKDLLSEHKKEDGKPKDASFINLQNVFGYDDGDYHNQTILSQVLVLKGMLPDTRSYFYLYKDGILISEFLGAPHENTNYFNFNEPLYQFNVLFHLEKEIANKNYNWLNSDAKYKLSTPSPVKIDGENINEELAGRFQVNLDSVGGYKDVNYYTLKIKISNGVQQNLEVLHIKRMGFADVETYLVKNVGEEKVFRLYGRDSQEGLEVPSCFYEKTEK